MIAKCIEIPLIIFKLLALLRRLDPFHPKRPDIEDSLRRYLSGYRGESSIDYHLSFLPDKSIHILHSLRIPDSQQRYFQVDILVLTLKFILIMEVKNLAGTLTFDPPNHQLIQSVNNKDFGYDDPVIQVRKHKQQLASFISANHLPDIPIIPHVITSNPSAIIKFTVNDKAYKESVIRTTFIPGRYETLDNIYKNNCFTDKEIRKLSRLIIKSHYALDQDVLEKFKIDPSDVNPGVHCPICFAIPMVRNNGTWECRNCGYFCKDAPLYTLYDRALIYGKNITNAQARSFLQIDSVSVVAKLLTKYALKYSGMNKGRIYELPYPPNDKDELLRATKKGCEQKYI